MAAGALLTEGLWQDRELQGLIQCRNHIEGQCVHNEGRQQQLFAELKRVNRQILERVIRYFEDKLRDWIIPKDCKQADHGGTNVDAMQSIQNMRAMDIDVVSAETQSTRDSLLSLGHHSIEQLQSKLITLRLELEILDGHKRTHSVFVLGIAF